MSLRTLRNGLGMMLVLWVALAQPGSAANWPRFRGPNGAGTASDKDIPVQWSEKEGVLWKTPLPGVGNSSPVVWGKNVFVQSAPSPNERVLICLQADTGKIAWTQSVPGNRAHTHVHNTLASSTPATDGERVYAVFWDGKSITLHAFDFQGKEVWKRDLGGFTSQHGVGSSPIIYEGKVILNNDQDGTSTLLAVDARTGKDVWQVPRKAFRTCYSTPFVVEEKGATPELIVLSTAGISGYDPKNGTEIWHWNWTFDGMALRTVGSAIYHQGMIFASSGDGKGDRHAIGIKKGTTGDVTKTNLLWENKKSLPYVPCMLTLGDHVYFVNDKGMAGCVEARTGKMVWFERLGGGFFASPVLIDDKVYAASDTGEVHVFLAAPTFKVLAKNTLGEPVMATPAVADGRLFLRAKNQLFCIGKK